MKCVHTSIWYSVTVSKNLQPATRSGSLLGDALTRWYAVGPAVITHLAGGAVKDAEPNEDVPHHRPVPCPCRPNSAGSAHPQSWIKDWTANHRLANHWLALRRLVSRDLDIPDRTEEVQALSCRCSLTHLHLHLHTHTHTRTHTHTHTHTHHHHNCAECALPSPRKLVELVPVYRDVVDDPMCHGPLVRL